MNQTVMDNREFEALQKIVRIAYRIYETTQNDLPMVTREHCADMVYAMVDLTKVVKELGTQARIKI